MDLQLRYSILRDVFTNTRTLSDLGGYNLRDKHIELNSPDIAIVYNKPIMLPSVPTRNTTPEVEAVIQKYRYLSRYVCTICGNPACVEITSYIASLCAGCWKQQFSTDRTYELEFIDTYETTMFFLGERVVETISVKDEWDRYLNTIKS